MKQKIVKYLISDVIIRGACAPYGACYSAEKNAWRKPHYPHEERPASWSSKQVFLINFHLAAIFFQNKLLAGNMYGTPHKNNWIIVHKIWNTTLFMWKIGFIHQQKTNKQKKKKPGFHIN